MNPSGLRSMLNESNYYLHINACLKMLKIKDKRTFHHRCVCTYVHITHYKILPIYQCTNANILSNLTILVKGTNKLLTTLTSTFSKTTCDDINPPRLWETKRQITVQKTILNPRRTQCSCHIRYLIRLSHMRATVLQPVRTVMLHHHQIRVFHQHHN